MSYFLLVMFGITIATIGLWRRTFWLRVALAATFLAAQILVLALLLDVHAHAALREEIEKRGALPQASHVIAISAQKQDRGSATLVTLGLCLLAILPHRTQR